MASASKRPKKSTGHAANKAAKHGIPYLMKQLDELNREESSFRVEYNEKDPPHGQCPYIQLVDY